MGRPVIAVASGGPLETVAHGDSGFLCEPEPQAFAEAMQKFAADPRLAQSMGEKGKRGWRRCSLSSSSRRNWTLLSKA